MRPWCAGPGMLSAANRNVVKVSARAIRELHIIMVSVYYRLPSSGQAAPLAAQSFTLARNSLSGMGTGERPSPGCHPQSTSGVDMCSTICWTVRCPFCFGILEQLTELAIGEPFPDHRHVGRGKVPIRRSRRRMQAREIVVLMTGAAFDGVQPVPVGSAPDLHGVRMAVVSLTRKVSGGVAIHAARMAQYGNDGLESGGGTSPALQRCVVAQRQRMQQKRHSA